jgi:hypothetical protein
VGTPSGGTRTASRLLPRLLSIGLRLVLLALAGVVMQVGWIGVWTLSYRLTHGNDFTFTYLMTQPDVWNKLMEWLVLGNTLVPGLEMAGFQGPASLDVVVNTLVMSFVVAGLGYLGAILLVDSGVSAVRGALLVVLAFELVFQATLFLTPPVHDRPLFLRDVRPHLGGLQPESVHLSAQLLPGNPLLN